MIEVPKVEVIKSLKEVQENSINQCKKMNKPIQDLEIEMELIKKTPNEELLEIKRLGIQTGTTQASFTNRI